MTLSRRGCFLPFLSHLYVSLLQHLFLMKLLTKAIMVGMVLAMITQNLFPEVYENVLEFHLLGHLSFSDFVMELLMAVFFLEVSFSLRGQMDPNMGQNGGVLSSFGKGMNILIGAVGGMVLPLLTFWSLASIFAPELVAGKFTPMATDIMFATAVANMFMKSTGQSMGYLLGVSIIDDVLMAVAVMILFPSPEHPFVWQIALLAVPLTIVVLIFSKYYKKRDTPLYVLFMVGYWLIFYYGGLHASQSLVLAGFIIPKQVAHRIEHQMRGDFVFLDLMRWIYLLFGFVAGGIHLETALTGDGGISGVVIFVIACVFGKQGIAFGSYLADFIGWKRDKDITPKDLHLIGLLGAIAFTMATFMMEVSVPQFPALKLGAVATLPVAGLLSWLYVKFMKVKIDTDDDTFMAQDHNGISSDPEHEVKVIQQ